MAIEQMAGRARVAARILSEPLVGRRSGLFRDPRPASLGLQPSLPSRPGDPSRNGWPPRLLPLRRCPSPIFRSRVRVHIWNKRTYLMPNLLPAFVC